MSPSLLSYAYVPCRVLLFSEAIFTIVVNNHTICRMLIIINYFCVAQNYLFKYKKKKKLTAHADKAAGRLIFLRLGLQI